MKPGFRAATISLCLFLFGPGVLTGCEIMNAQPNNSTYGRPEVRDVTWAARNNGDLRKKIIVLPFLDANNDPPSVKAMARHILVRELVSTGEFIVINNDNIPEDIHTFIKNNDYDMSAVSRVAETLGVAAVIEGKIINLQTQNLGDSIGLFRTLRTKARATIRIRAYSANTGKQMLNVTRQATVESDTTQFANSEPKEVELQNDPALDRLAVTKVIHQTVGDIMRTVNVLSWQGRIALISGDKVYIDAGRLSGIQIGDILRVSEKGQEVFDPQTGVYIGTAPGRMMGTLEVVSYFGKDGAIAIIHSGGGFKENDLVEMY